MYDMVSRGMFYSLKEFKHVRVVVMCTARTSSAAEASLTACSRNVILLGPGIVS